MLFKGLADHSGGPWISRAPIFHTAQCSFNIFYFFCIVFRMQAIQKTVFMNCMLSPRKLTVATQKVHSQVTLYAYMYM